MDNAYYVLQGKMIGFHSGVWSSNHWNIDALYVHALPTQRVFAACPVLSRRNLSNLPATLTVRRSIICNTVLVVVLGSAIFSSMPRLTVNWYTAVLTVLIGLPPRALHPT